MDHDTQQRWQRLTAQMQGAADAGGDTPTVRGALLASRLRAKERERLARELHDTLLQEVIAVTLHMEAAARLLPATTEARARLTCALVRAEQIIERVRARIGELHTPITSAQALGTALTHAGAELQTLYPGTPMRVAMHGRDPGGWRAPVLEETYWIAREALINAFRHARATRIEVSMHHRAREFELIVRDNGVGLPASLDGGHHGLWSMQERARELGGQLRLSSAPGCTEISLRLPACVAYGDAGMQVKPAPCPLVAG